MDLFWFFVQQFKVPILGLLIFGSLLLIRIFVLPVKQQLPPQGNEGGEDISVENQKQPGK